MKLCSCGKKMIRKRWSDELTFQFPPHTPDQLTPVLPSCPGLGWSLLLLQMSPKGHPAAESSVGVDVEFQWGGEKKIKGRKEESFNFLGICCVRSSIASGRARLCLGTTSDSAKLSLSRLFTSTWKDKFKDREGTAMEGTQL